MSEDQGQEAKKWIDEAEEALSRTGEALRTAWSESKEARMATLEAAREAAALLGKAIDKGIDAARETWDSAERQPSADAESAQAEPSPDPITPDEIQEEK